MYTPDQFRRVTPSPAPARQLAAQGRGGDSMLVHMRPDEVSAMQQMAQRAGKSMTVNPQTGLPEAFSLKSLFNINTYTDPIQKGMQSAGLGGLYNTASNVAQKVGENAQYIIPFIPGAALSSVGLGALSSPLARGLLGGAIGTFAGGRPNLKRGLMTGLTSYGLSSAYQGLQQAGGGAGDVYKKIPEGLPTPPGAPAEQSLQTIATPQTRTEFEAATQGVKNLASSDKATRDMAATAFGKEFGMGKTYATAMGISGVKMLDESEKQNEAARAAGRISEEQYQAVKSRIAENRRRAEQAVRSSPYQYAMGGAIPLSMKSTPDTETNAYGMKRGGRYIDGHGDGMSDSVPAVIDGKQPARLADGEFVIPADVVSHIGNGSTKAGARQLYAMMDRIRKARTGTKKQGREINPAKYLPA